MLMTNEVTRGKAISAAMAELGLSRPTIYRLLAQGRLHAVKVGSKTLITSDSIEAFWRGLPVATFREPGSKAA